MMSIHSNRCEFAQICASGPKTFPKLKKCNVLYYFPVKITGPVPIKNLIRFNLLIKFMQTNSILIVIAPSAKITKKLHLFSTLFKDLIERELPFPGLSMP